MVWNECRGSSHQQNENNAQHTVYVFLFFFNCPLDFYVLQLVTPLHQKAQRNFNGCFGGLGQLLESQPVKGQHVEGLFFE